VLNTFTCAAEFTQWAIEALPIPQTAGGDGGGVPQAADQFVAGLNQIPGFRCQAPDGAFTLGEYRIRALREEVQSFYWRSGRTGIAGGIRPGGKKYLRFRLSVPETARGSANASSASRFIGAPRFALILEFRLLWSNQGADVGPGKMKHLIHFGAALLMTLAGTKQGARAGETAARCDLQKTYDRLLKQIDQISILRQPTRTQHFRTTPYGRHGFAPEESTVDAPPDTNPEFVAAAKALFGYPYDDFKPEHAKWLIDKEERPRNGGRTAYWDSISTNKYRDMPCQSCCAGLYLDPKRFIGCSSLIPSSFLSTITI